MEQTEYKATFKKIFARSFFSLIFFYLFFLIFLIVLILGHTESLILLLPPALIMNFFPIWIHLNYWCFTYNKKLVITNSFITIHDLTNNTEHKILFDEILTFEITKYKYGITSRSSFPWSDYEFLCITDKNHTKMIIPFYFLESSQSVTLIISKIGLKIGYDKTVIINKNKFPLIK